MIEKGYIVLFHMGLVVAQVSELGPCAASHSFVQYIFSSCYVTCCNHLVPKTTVSMQHTLIYSTN